MALDKQRLEHILSDKDVPYYPHQIAAQAAIGAPCDLTNALISQRDCGGSPLIID